MTWSIVARDPESGAVGVAVTSKFFAVGALCPHLRAGGGALSTQALVNPLYGPQGLALLAEGRPAEDVVARLVAGDAGRETRQVHAIDMAGRVAAHTGRDCIEWCGHLLRDGFSVAGNMLAGPRVVEATAEAYEAASGESFAERLIRGLEAGQAAGGDKRGKQSAALRIHATEDYPWLDLRVDDHPEPLVELRRLWREAQRVFIPFTGLLAKRGDAAGVFDRAVIEAAVAEAQAVLDAAGRS